MNTNAMALYVVGLATIISILIVGGVVIYLTYPRSKGD